jgi:hypothetical protein
MEVHISEFTLTDKICVSLVCTVFFMTFFILLIQLLGLFLPAFGHVGLLNWWLAWEAVSIFIFFFISVDYQGTVYKMFFAQLGAVVGILFTGMMLVGVSQSFADWQWSFLIFLGWQVPFLTIIFILPKDRKQRSSKD